MRFFTALRSVQNDKNELSDSLQGEGIKGRGSLNGYCSPLPFPSPVKGDGDYWDISMSIFRNNVRIEKKTGIVSISITGD
jgi:hypothetical protein